MTEFGKPFAAAGFGNWFRHQCDMANCSPHQIAQYDRTRSHGKGDSRLTVPQQFRAYPQNAGP
jgi:hypothetical protein